MSDEILLTTLQISDMHFGSMPGGSTAKELDSHLPVLQGRVGWVDGLLGHHHAGLREIHRFHQNLLEEVEGRLCVVNTGDLTACGGSTQFELAADFLGNEKPVRFGFGLGLADWADLTVTGNHDQWPGSNLIVGGPGHGLTRILPRRFPRIGPLCPLDASAAIRFLFVDSDADVGHISWDRILARGSFGSQLKELNDRMPDREDGEVRVLLVHHAIGSTGDADVDLAVPFPRGSADRRLPLAIDRGTLRVLRHFLIRHGIRLVLTGHLHVPRLVRYMASDGVEPLEIMEARCGTTTQWDHYPPEVLKNVSDERRLPPNTLIRHDLIRRSGKLLWSARIHWRSKGGGFVDRHDHVSNDLPRSLSREIDVS